MPTQDQNTIVRMKSALAKGRMVYDTGRKCGKFPVYEQLSEDGRKLMGLTPLAEIIPNWKQLLPIRKVKKEKDWIVGSNLNSKILVGSLKEIKDELVRGGKQ